MQPTGLLAPPAPDALGQLPASKAVGCKAVGCDSSANGWICGSVITCTRGRGVLDTTDNGNSPIPSSHGSLQQGPWCPSTGYVFSAAFFFFFILS
jgi:hypothetical protein